VSQGSGPLFFVSEMMSLLRFDVGRIAQAYNVQFGKLILQ